MKSIYKLYHLIILDIPSITETESKELKDLKEYSNKFLKLNLTEEYLIQKLFS